jgi:hypothetical protein
MASRPGLTAAALLVREFFRQSRYRWWSVAFVVRHEAWGIMIHLRSGVRLNDGVAIPHVRAPSPTSAHAFGLGTVARCEDHHDR